MVQGFGIIAFFLEPVVQCALIVPGFCSSSESLSVFFVPLLVLTVAVVQTAPQIFYLFFPLFFRIEFFLAFLFDICCQV